MNSKKDKTNDELRERIREPLIELWGEYTQDERVALAKEPIGDAVFSFEGFFHWFLFDVTEASPEEPEESEDDGEYFGPYFDENGLLVEPGEDDYYE